MVTRLERFRRAEARLAKDLSEGKRPSIVDKAWITSWHEGALAIATLERLAGVATDASVHAEFLRDAVVSCVKFEIWDGFEGKARAALRALRVLPRGGGAKRPTLIVVGTDQSGTFSLLLRDIALASSRYLRKNGRGRHAIRLLRRIASHDPIRGKHLAETEAGLLWLEAGDLEKATAHVTASLTIADDAELVLHHSWELVLALEAAGVHTPEVLAARQRLVKLRLGHR